MKKIILTIILSLSAMAAQAVELTKDQNLQYARQCQANTKEYISTYKKDNFKVLNKYTYWPSKVVEVNRYGATITTKVKTSYTYEEGDNGGWGTAEKKTDSYTFTCLFVNNKKGEYEKPDAFKRSVDEERIWLKRTGTNCELFKRSSCKDFEDYAPFQKDGSSVTSGYSDYDNSNWSAYYYDEAIKYLK